MLSPFWILLQSLVYETRRCTVYPISTCPLLYRPLLRLPFFLVCCMLPPRPTFVPSLGHSHTHHPNHPADRRHPHLKSTAATSHHPPQPPPSPTIKICNSKQRGVIQGSGKQTVMGGGGREQESIQERTVQYAGAVRRPRWRVPRTGGGRRPTRSA